MTRDRIREVFGLDLRSLAVFRVVLSGILLLDLFQRSQSLVAHYTDAGVMPRTVMYRAYWVNTNWTLHALSGDAPLQALLFAVSAATVVAMMVGWQTRYATIAQWVLLASLHTRNGLVQQGGDDLLRMLVFWSMFLPLGARWSLDARGGTAPAHRVVSVGSVALILQICYVYWATAYLKWSPLWFPEGAAIEMALRLDAYATWPGKWMLAIAPQQVLAALTIAVLAWEYAGPVLALSPVWTGPARFAACVGMIAMHLGFGATLEIGLFWMISIACWLVMLPPWFWDRLGDRFPRARTAPGQGTLGGDGPVSNVLALAVLTYITAWNLRSLDGRANYQNALKWFPTTLNPPAYLFRTDQYWSMFAPAPPTRDGWWVVPGRLDDGREVDLYAMRDTVSWERPRHIAGTYDGQRWRKFMFNLPDHEAVRPHYARWLKDRWERAHPGEPRVRHLELTMVIEQTLPHGQRPVERKVFATFDYP